MKRYIVSPLPSVHVQLPQVLNLRGRRGGGPYAPRQRSCPCLQLTAAASSWRQVQSGSVVLTEVAVVVQGGQRADVVSAGSVGAGAGSQGEALGPGGGRVTAAAAAIWSRGAHTGKTNFYAFVKYRLIDHKVYSY